MSNKYTEFISEVFVNLEKNAINDLPIPKKERYINPYYIKEKNDYIIDILKYAKFKIFKMSTNISCMCICYKSIYYLVFPYDFGDVDYAILINDDIFNISFGILAISQSLLLPIKENSFDIYDKILASELEHFDFDDIVLYYKNYTIFEMNSLMYIEEIYRFTGSILIKNLSYTSNILTQNTYNNLSKLLAFESTRSISICIIRCLDSYLLDHCFLEIYRCVEFLFYLQIAFDISEKYENSDLNLIIDLVYKREIIHKEQDTLESLIKNIKNSDLIDGFYDFLINNGYANHQINSNKYHVIAEHIYDLRCKTAHLKYRHEYVHSNYKWDILIENFSSLVLIIYELLDEKILQICRENNVWKDITEIWNK